MLSCQLAMGLGTLSGGWRIVQDDGHAADQAEAVRRLLRRDRRGRSCCSWPARWACRCRPRTPSRARIVGVGCVNTPARRALGRRAAHRLGVGVHDPVGGPDRGGDLFRAARFSSLRRCAPVALMLMFRRRAPPRHLAFISRGPLMHHTAQLRMAWFTVSAIRVRAAPHRMREDPERARRRQHGHGLVGFDGRPSSEEGRDRGAGGAAQEGREHLRRPQVAGSTLTPRAPGG